MNNNIKISPSLFAADIFDLKSQIKILERCKVDLLHIDVMDGNFVSRMAFGAEHIQMIKKHTKIPLDVHLMVKYPEKHISDILEAGADIITIHQESTSCLYHCLEMIQRKGRMAGEMAGAGRFSDESQRNSSHSSSKYKIYFIFN